MKKLFLSLLAILLIAGVAYAVSIPVVEDATTGPGVWLVPVYNNLGSTMDAGDVAIWDIDSSTGDNDNYVTTTSTAETGGVAGVVYPNDITAGDTVTIAIRGVVNVDTVTQSLIVADTPLCTSTTAGSAAACTTATGEARNFGRALATHSGNSVLMYVNP